MAGDTQAERNVPADGNVAVGKSSGAYQTAPIGWHEAARDGNASITQHKLMPACDPGEQSEPVVWKPVAVQITNEPAATCVRFHPANERDDLVVRQMMRELRADD